MMLPLALVLLAAPVEVPSLEEDEAPAGDLNGPSSARFARDVLVTFAKGAVAGPTDVGRENKKGTYGTSTLPQEALGRHALAVCLRHFEDAEWDRTLVAGAAHPAETHKKGKRGWKKDAGLDEGRVIVIRSIELSAAIGPRYMARVVVDRLEDGRRKGQATGTGMAVIDRSSQSRAASFAPGPFGAVAARKAVQPRLARDEDAIRQATLRAFDQALLQLAAVWAGEQATAEILEKNRAPQSQERTRSKTSKTKEKSKAQRKRKRR